MRMVVIVAATLIGVFAAAPVEARRASGYGLARHSCHCERYTSPYYAGDDARSPYQRHRRR